MRYPTARKTVEVVHLVVSFNRAIAKAYRRGVENNDPGAFGEAKALSFALETVLHNSGNYAGYTYLESIDWQTADQATKDRVETGRSYIFSDTVCEAFRAAYQWCNACKEYHVIDDAHPSRCSWCHSVNVTPA